MSRFLCCRLTVFWRALWCLKEVGDENETVDFWWHSWQNVDFLNEISFYFPSSATLLVAVNEIKKSARQNGVSFYEYGVYNSNLMIFLQAT